VRPAARRSASAQSCDALVDLLDQCLDAMRRRGDVLSSPPHTVTNGTPVSIAQRLSNDHSPWGRKLPITIIGYSVIHEVRGGETGQQTWMLVGSASGRPGADVFAMTAGQGNSSSSLMFPPGIGLPHSGKSPDAPIDVYGSCLGGAEQRGRIAIFYTSP
jgi:hypothetical protein